MKKHAPLLVAIGGIVILLIATAVVVSRQRVQRHRVFRPAAGEKATTAPGAIPAVEQWSDAFRTLPPDDLAKLLGRIEQERPDAYAKWSLAYLHARALLESGEEDDAAEKLAPFLAKESPFRELALYHQAAIATDDGDAEAASRARTQLIFEHASSPYRAEAIEDEIDHRASLDDPQPLQDLAAKLAPSLPTSLRRDLSARLAEAMMRQGKIGAARDRAFAILAGGTTDDASDRASRLLDRPELVKAMTPEQHALVGETLRTHRHYDRAVAFLSIALRHARTAKKTTLNADDLQFSLGRAYFGNEQFAEARQTYMAGANATRLPEKKATFLFHASRAAQLLGDDAAGERLMTAAISVPGRFGATSAALSQRIRTRAKHGRIAEAAADVALVRKLVPNDRAVLDSALAYSVALVARGSGAAAAAVLNTIPAKVLDDYDRAELAYWRARALENGDPPAAFRNYLAVLRSPAPTHFAYFARQRLDSPAMAPKLTHELQVREAQVANLLEKKQYDLARRIQTDRVLLSSRDHGRQLKILQSIYRELPDYRAVLELKPEPLPHFPLDDIDATDERSRATLLMAMGLHDEAVDEIQRRWDLKPARAALTRSLALNLAGASRESIYAIEVLMKRVPDDFEPELLPTSIRHLLYPRYFYDYIVSDADRYDADPRLVLSIMREESRFNPRAKSAAAARGLLQFIITTARDIGRSVGLVDVDPEDLYDPRVIIRLGAKYVAELLEQFGDNRYNAAGAYNAGPKQVALWSRLQAGPGNDFFLTAVNFDETKHYVRKVMNSYAKYGEIYGNEGPTGGLRAEP